MIIKRVVKNVKEQNWLAVFLDFLVVVLGIFIGLQATEWNDFRSQQKQERYLAKRLYTELNAKITSNLEFIESQSERNEKGRACLDKIYNKTLTEEEGYSFVEKCFLPYMFSSTDIDAFLELPTIMELFNTDSFKSISDKELRAAIFDYINRLNSAKESARFIHNLFVPTLTYFQTNIKQRPSAQMEFDYQLNQSQLLTNDTLYNYMVNSFTLKVYGYAVVVMGVNHQQKLAEELEQYLDKNKVQD